MYELHFAMPMSGAILNNINTHTVFVLLRHNEAISLFLPNTISHRLVLIADDSSAPSCVAPLDHFMCMYENLVDRGDERFEWSFTAIENDGATGEGLDVADLVEDKEKEGVWEAIEEVVIDGGVGFQTITTNSSNRPSYSVGSFDYIVDEEESEVWLSNAEREGAGCKG
ncbi:hypothetical protein ACFX2H_039194 [Malus domestica]